MEQQEGKQNNTNRNIYKVLLIGIVVLVLIIVLGLSSWNNQLRTQRQNLVSPPSTVSIQKVEQGQVAITNDGFIPATITVKRGSQVTWMNQDIKLHQVSSDPHPAHTGLPGFDSEEPLATNDSYTFTFEETGTFTYHDHLNPLKFKGTIIVE